MDHHTFGGHRKLNSKVEKMLTKLSIDHQDDLWWRQDSDDAQVYTTWNTSLTTLEDIGVVISFYEQEDFDAEEYDVTPMKPTLHQLCGEWCETSELIAWSPPDSATP